MAGLHPAKVPPAQARKRVLCTPPLPTHGDQLDAKARCGRVSDRSCPLTVGNGTRSGIVWNAAAVFDPNLPTESDRGRGEPLGCACGYRLGAPGGSGVPPHCRLPGAHRCPARTGVPRAPVSRAQRCPARSGPSGQGAFGLTKRQRAATGQISWAGLRAWQIRRPCWIRLTWPSYISSGSSRARNIS